MKKSFLTIQNSSQSGFTLIELMVSLTLFIIIVVALIGSLYTVNDASRKVQAMRTIMDNVNFAVETMSRNVKTSQNIKCGTRINCPIKDKVPSNTISMISTLGEPQYIQYSWESDFQGKGKIVKRTAPYSYDSVNDEYIIGELSSPVNITAPEIDIQKMRFFVDGVGAGDQKQPSVIIKFEGVAKVVGSTSVPFAIQTFLSQRTPE